MVATGALGRSSTALEPYVLDVHRRALKCNSLQEREAWLRYFISVQPSVDEGDYETSVSEGVLPKYVRGGSFFRSGPGLFERNSTRIHMADGDGLLLRIDFTSDGRILVKERYLQTPEFLKESQSDRVLYRGSYGTSQVQGDSFTGTLRKNIGNLDWKVTGNTNHLFWGGKLYALHEIGLPIELNPLTLDVIDARSTLNGLLTPSDVFSAHYRIDRQQNTLLNYGLNYKDRKGPVLKFWEFDAKFKVKSRSSFNLGKEGLRTIAHSFAATDHYFIQLLAPCKGGFKYFLGWGVDDSIYHDHAAPYAYICVAERNTIDRNEATWYKCVNWWPNHHVGAFEDAAGNIILDSVMYERKTVGWIERTPFDLPPTRLVRLTIPQAGKRGQYNTVATASSVVVHEVLYNNSCEMPVTHPRTELGDHQFVWLVDMSATKMPNAHAAQQGLSHAFGEALIEMPWAGIVKVDIKTKAFQVHRPGRFCGEVVFIPDPSPEAREDDGVLLSLVFDPVTLKSDLLAFDARDITKGFIARIPLRGHIPFSFHCGWESHFPTSS